MTTRQQTDQPAAEAVPFLESWERIQAAFAPAYATLMELERTLAPPPFHRPQGPLLHNGRKPR